MMQGNVFCLHELLSKFDSPTGCAQWMNRVAENLDGVGMSDSGAVFFQDALAAKIPDARWVVVVRPQNDSEDSFLKEHGLNVSLGMHRQKIDELIAKRNPLVVEFDEIDRRIVEIAEYCVPKWNHDRMRHSMLLGFNIKLTDYALKSGMEMVRNSELLNHLELPQSRKDGE